MGYLECMAGRPPKEQSDRRDKPLRIRLTPDERARIDRAAESIGLQTSGWARMVLLKAALDSSPQATDPERRTDSGS